MCLTFISTNSGTERTGGNFAMEWKLHVFIFCLLVLAVHSQEETSCKVLMKEEYFVGIYLTHSLRSPPSTFTVLFYNASSDQKEKVLDCALINAFINDDPFTCDVGKGYWLHATYNTVYVTVKRPINHADGFFAVSINEETTRFCLLEETSCKVLMKEEYFVGIYLTHSLRSPPSTFTVSFYNASSDQKETILECDLPNDFIKDGRFVCDFGKGYSLHHTSNAFYVTVKRPIKCSYGFFAVTINEEKTNRCSRDGIDVSAEQRRRSDANWYPRLEPPSHQTTSESESNPCKPQDNSNECSHGTVEPTVANKNSVKGRPFEPPLPLGRAENFQHKNGANHFATELGLGIGRIAVVAAAFFFNWKQCSFANS